VSTSTNGASGAKGKHPKPDHEVAIIGAGLGGLGMAAALKRKNIQDFVVFERADDVGGTWRDNTYPGIGVDIPVFAYQFSYDLKPDWSRFFPKGHEVKDYIDEYTDKHAIRPHIRFNSEVRSRTWDEGSHLWRLDVGGEEVTARYVISAIGPFVDPKPADIPGLDDFEGKLIHSARWDHDYELAGKRVAIVGTGASAVQIIPTIAPEVGRLDVFQRTPIWVSPKFDPKIPGWMKRLFARLPFTERIARAIASAGTEFVIVFMALNFRRFPGIVKGVERRNRRFLASQVKDPDLRRKLTPDYGMGCKRPSISNDYLRTFNRDNVELVTDEIDRITPSGIRTADGEEREVDALILATGFRLASDPEIFRRTPVRGRDGFDLATRYEDHRLKAYESISMPGLPNHFMIFGPYGWTGASWHVLVQTASTHITRVLEEARRRGSSFVEVSEEATDRYHAKVLERMEGSLWFSNRCDGANSYYFDHHGDVPYVRPSSGREARKAARSFPLSDYRYDTTRRSPEPAKREKVTA
jgi:cation diffusion facilitator CzcD-associated flavoprotein CzcO